MFKKKFIICLMSLLCIIGIFGCSNKNDEEINDKYISNETSIFLNSENLMNLKMGLNSEELNINVSLPISYKATGYCNVNGSTEILIQNKEIEKVEDDNIYSDISLINKDAGITMSISIKDKNNENATEYINFIKTMEDNENYKNKNINNYNVYAEKTESSIFAIYESIEEDFLICINYENDNIEEINLNNFLNEFSECIY